jgi:hypothetical protein
VELIQDHSIFHNNSNIPQLPTPTQLAIFLVCISHYGNVLSPEYVAQWAGVSIGTVVNSTYCCLVVFLALHDKAVMIPPEEEKEQAKELSVDRLLEWANAPRLWWVHRVCPHPFAWLKDLPMVLECLHTSECPHVMHAASVTQQVISNQEVLRLADDLENCQYLAAKRLDSGAITHLTVDRVVFVLVKPCLPM